MNNDRTNPAATVDVAVIPQTAAAPSVHEQKLQQLATERQELKQRVEEAGVLYKLSSLLSAHRDLDQLLNTAAKSAAEVMRAKACSIRLLNDDKSQLVARAAYNLSDGYINKGSILVAKSELAQKALSGEVVYVEDLAKDPRTLYPGDVKREGLVSMLSVPMIFKGRPIGTVRVYTEKYRRFSASAIDLLRAVAHLLAAALEHARLDEEYLESQRVQRQLKLAAAVQRRMMPATMPNLPPFDIAAKYDATLELGGDFFDFIQLDGHLGIAIGDVVGKGVAASLLMASVRASLRAYAQDVYDIDEIVSRVNVSMSRDTLDNEFATLFYGVLDPQTRRLTYCNAGHEPPLLYRDGNISRLDAGGMIVGVDANQRYDKGIVALKPGDILMLYTDGLTEAFNFAGEQFGRERITQAMRQVVDAKMNAATAVKHILWQLRTFTGLRTNIDDTTIVLIRVTDEAPRIEVARDI